MGMKNIIIGSLYASGDDFVFPSGILPIGAIWFLWGMFWSQLLFWILSKLDFKIAFPIAILFAITATRVSKSVFLPLSILPGCFALPYLFVGQFIRKYNITIKWGKRKAALLYLLGFSAVGYSLMIYFYSGVYIVNCNYGNGLFDYIGTLPCVMFFGLLSTIAAGHKKISKMFRFYGANSLVFLAIHNIELYVFPYHSVLKFLTNRFLHFSISSQLEVLITFIAKIILITLIMRACCRMPLFRKVYRIN